jgi:LPXTG-motif cell wall-anchored protein
VRRSIIAAVVAAALVAGWSMPSSAQENGVVIQNNGVDSSDSAAGADNVHISNSPGNGKSSSGGGLNNNTGTAKERKRKDRGAGNNAETAPVEEYAAPADEYVPPAEGDYQAYADEGYVEPAPAVAESVADVSTEPDQVLKLPSTGAGSETSMPFAAAVGLMALSLGATSLRRRRLI